MHNYNRKHSKDKAFIMKKGAFIIRTISFPQHQAVCYAAANGFKFGMFRQA